MRESVGTTTLFKMAIVFTLIFSAFLALTIVYNKVYRLKNESLSILEKYEGTPYAFQIVNNYLKNNGYNTKGKCKNEFGMYGVKDYDNNVPEEVVEGEEYYYCVSYSCENDSCVIIDDTRIYYNIELFYKFNVPILGNFANFRITGQTKAIKLYDGSQKF